MRKIKIITVLGTRPEVIKLAPVIKELEKHNSKIISKVVLTGQHRVMVDQFLEFFQIKPDYDLDIMLKNQTLFDVSSRCMERLAKVLEKERPDLMLVEGDTTTAFIASLCAFYLKISVGHVEAGLRTHDKYRPFPEEINRCLITVVADLHFAPTKRARENLLKEGIDKKKIYLTGNTVIDAIYAIAGKDYPVKNKQLRKIDFKNKKVILVTAHRRESFGGSLLSICRALKEISAFKDVEIIYPVHLNPNVQKPVQKLLNNRRNIHLLSPLDYESFVYVLKNCYFALTDSGGVQEEAPAFGKPILVMREVTERPEGVDSGVARLVGMNSERIVAEAKKLLFSKSAYDKMAKSVNPYGDGHAAERIVKAIINGFR
ncbi:MAG: UDP-N-acetylglucosamine 2-epimerase (non-hydrolyzing) [Candidatus Omnitrophica bacterium]|nr:UDP-N-acetylglucosamine 2-epimerase (non-hydrolyzing) [Candidatus Omnitrophota bacterium]MBU4478281.1 UDP-N-acetylglucosamine 2-epimerase (non-hydrolyzing) [Candidatus Omnitrophota bacterium]MCG2703349.1 UDP-N-acetylglucosamine 2-epimerase (non-hydrolyzing) [Candidatus Omnitrophota bacterium]